MKGALGGKKKKKAEQEVASAQKLLQQARLLTLIRLCLVNAL